MTSQQFVWLLGCLFLAAASAHAQQEMVPVVGVEDGDTLVALVDGAETRLQLLGIDAPEDVENPKLLRDIQRTGLEPGPLTAIGSAATAHLNTLVAAGELVRLDGNLHARDRYGRVPVEAYLRTGRSLNEAMVQDGYAMVLSRAPLPKDLRNRLRRHEAEAIAEGRGLWGLDPVTTMAWSGGP